ncbi:MAG: DNA repair and recombination protein RadA [Candidatus Lokiarchaeota archaeon]|nr:DNA repair and recombination protein RadA [Candidatus Lokiarchaeota archaeon]
MAELDLVKNINARQIKLLQENGISSAEALAMSPHNIISEIDGLGDKTAKKLIWNARNALGMSEFTTAEEIDENTEYITTGSAELNRILGGGFQTGKLTEVYGPFKSGKTNLAHTIAVSTQLPKNKGGLGSKVAYIDTENTFSKEKIKRIAKRFGMDPKKVLSGIFHARIFSSDHQSQMITKAETLCKTRGVRLIIMDSLMALMRAEYVGIGMLARRQAVLNNMIHALSRISETYNCAVLLTNQVATKMMGMFSGDDAIGGNIIAHGCHFRVMFKTKGFSSNNSLKRRAIIVDAPDLPPEEAEFYITSVGIADTENAEMPKGDTNGFEVPSLYEDFDEDEVVAPIEPEATPESEDDEEKLTTVKGIGTGMAVQLKKAGINSVYELISAPADEIASKVSGASLKKVQEWQGNAKGMIQA